MRHFVAKNSLGGGAGKGPRRIRTGSDVSISIGCVALEPLQYDGIADTVDWSKEDVLEPDNKIVGLNSECELILGWLVGYKLVSRSVL